MRRPHVGDASFYLDLMNDPDFHRNIGDRGLRDAAAMEIHIRDKLLTPFQNRGFGMWLVETRHNKQPIGVCGLVDRDGFEGLDLGYAFLSAHRGQGFATEAANAVLEFSASMLGITSLFAIVAPENVRSKKLLGKIGFTWRERSVFPATGDPIDIYDWNIAESLGV